MFVKVVSRAVFSEGIILWEIPVSEQGLKPATCRYSLYFQVSAHTASPDLRFIFTQKAFISICWLLSELLILHVKCKHCANCCTISEQQNYKVSNDSRVFTLIPAHLFLGGERKTCTHNPTRIQTHIDFYLIPLWGKFIYYTSMRERNKKWIRDILEK